MIGFFNAWMRSARMPPPSRGDLRRLRHLRCVGSNACAPPEMSAPAQNARPVTGDDDGAHVVVGVDAVEDVEELAHRLGPERVELCRAGRT